MTVPSSKVARQSPWPRSGPLVNVVSRPSETNSIWITADAIRRRVRERPDRAHVRSAGQLPCRRRRRRRAPGSGSRVDAAPTTTASPSRSRARSYRCVACSMTCPPPSSARPHQAGAGVESSQRATTSWGGAAASRSRSSGRMSSPRRWYPTATTRRARAISSARPIGPEPSAAASGFSVRNGKRRATSRSSDRDGLMWRHGYEDRLGVRSIDHRLEVVVRRPAPAFGDVRGRLARLRDDADELGPAETLEGFEMVPGAPAAADQAEPQRHLSPAPKIPASRNGAVSSSWS